VAQDRHALALALAPSRECRMVGFFSGFHFPFSDEVGFFTIVPP
jgi:hypothetical protein